jgi:hypothetical protein
MGARLLPRTLPELFAYSLALSPQIERLGRHVLIPERFAEHVMNAPQAGQRLAIAEQVHAVVHEGRTALEAYRDRHDLAWEDPKLRLIDLQYHDVDPARGLFHRLRTSGRIECLVSDEEVERAMISPPSDTRAFFRGSCLARYAGQLAAASWDALIFDLDGRTLKRIPMLDPHRGTAAHTEALLAAHPDPEGLIEALQG